MEERIDNETVQQIDLISMLKDIGREWLTILLLAIAAALFADIWICATYQPEYRTSTTFVVTAKGMNNNIYQNLNSTKELAGQFTEILGSNVLKKKVAQDLGVNSLEVETSVDLVPETNLITLSVKAGTAAESYRILQSVMENYNTPVQAIEPFLWTFGDGTAVLLSSMLLLLLFSDQPKMTPVTPYQLIRTTKKNGS